MDVLVAVVLEVLNYGCIILCTSTSNSQYNNRVDYACWYVFLFHSYESYYYNLLILNCIFMA